MNLLNRISKIASQEGISITKLEAVIGASKGVISRAIKNNTDIQSKWLQKIVKEYPQYSTRWLLTGDGIIFNKEKPPQPSDVDDNFPNIPLFTMKDGLLFSELIRQKPSGKNRTVSFPNIPDCDGAIIMATNAMSPILKSGDMILFKILKDFKSDIFFGEMYIVTVKISTTEITLVRYIQKSNLGAGYYSLSGHDDTIQPKDVAINQITSIALVRASIKINTMH